LKTGAGCAVATALAAAAASACEDDFGPLHFHPDVVTIEVLLVAGESEARMLAVHPHRGPGAPAPEVDARLLGPGWEAAFSETLPLEACTAVQDLGSRKCLRAALPEPVRAGGAYGLTGTAPLGAFTGEARVPDPPLLETDTLHLSWPDEGDRIRIPLRYRAGSDIGVLGVDVRDIFETRDDGTEVELPVHELRLVPWIVDPAATADTVLMDIREKPLRFSMLLLGIGWTWAKYRGLGIEGGELEGGIEGEGVYGYLDGVAPSGPMPVLVR